MWSCNRLRRLGRPCGCGADTWAEPVTVAHAHTSSVADAIAEPNAGASRRAVTDTGAAVAAITGTCAAVRRCLPDHIGPHAAGRPGQDLHDAECRGRGGAEW